MSEPRTAAGLAMLAEWHENKGPCYDSPACDHGQDIAAIEQEAAALDVERLALFLHGRICDRRASHDETLGRCWDLAREYEKLRTPEGSDSLDAAWAEAEAALPEGWHLCEVSHEDAVWVASAYGETHGNPDGAEGSTPAAALRALAEKLRTPEGEG